ncbi:DUF6879 family protein [Actinopolymorpha sp. B11F2]|uniref:DUF6879 family protein n=1 Tax=Actinopolymorpha sp. B11F2 TaxID=3160862 RepID=UPI0032E47271
MTGVASHFVSGKGFVDFVRSYRYTAFRLEVRDNYAAPEEEEPVRRFLSGEAEDDSWMDDWCGMIMRRSLSGVRMERVRVVSEPWSDYTRFGLHLSRLNVAAGEDIRYLPRDQAKELELPDYDFWLIDARRMCILRHDGTGVLLGADVIDDPAVVVEHCYYREVARHYALPRAHYLSERGSCRDKQV